MINLECFIDVNNHIDIQREMSIMYAERSFKNSWKVYPSHDKQ